MELKIPINNVIELIVADLYVNVQCKLQPQIPVEKTEAKVALQTIENKIELIFQEAVLKAKKELENNLI